MSWTSASPSPSARITLDTSCFQAGVKLPKISYNLDGIWVTDVPCDKEIFLENIDPHKQQHELTVILSASDRAERWGGEGVSGTNVLRVTGVQVDEGSLPTPTEPAGKWALIIGDSITEGIGASPLASYSHLLGQALRTRGYEYGISACGYSGWLVRGDKPPGDVPGYYCVTDSVNGTGGKYNDAESRWNKIDGNGHSLLDAMGRLSAYGKTGQEPSLIFINYGTNDHFQNKNPRDLKASIQQSLEALRKSAPKAQIIVAVPFGQYCAGILKEAVERRKYDESGRCSIAIIDLGPGAARALTPKDPKSRTFGDVHPNDRGAANFAAMLIPQVLDCLGGKP